MKNYKVYILAIIAFLTILSCDENDSVTTENCTLATVTNYDGDDGEELMQATYTDGKLTQLLGNSLKYVYEYNNDGKVITKYYIELAQGFNDTLKTTYSYNSDGTIHEEKFYQLNNGTYELYALVRFQYTNNKLTTSDFYYYENGTENFEGTNTYIYTGNNITTITYNDASTVITNDYIYEFTVDTSKQNPFHSISNQMYALDTYIDDDTFFVLPVYTNPNLVTTIIETENGNTPFTKNIAYQFDISPQSNNLLKQVTLNGDVYYKFTYNCN